MSITTLTENCRAIHAAWIAKGRHFYSDDLRAVTIAEAYKLGAKSVTVAVAGVRLDIHYIGSVLIWISPTSASAGRGECCLWVYDKEDTWVRNGYWFDRCSRVKTGKSVDVAYIAWIAAQGNLPDFAKALGVSGYCACCGRGLSDPISMARGIGPECYSAIWGGLDMVRLAKLDKIAAN